MHLADQRAPDASQAAGPIKHPVLPRDTVGHTHLHAGAVGQADGRRVRTEQRRGARGVAGPTQCGPLSGSGKQVPRLQSWLAAGHGCLGVSAAPSCSPLLLAAWPLPLTGASSAHRLVLVYAAGRQGGDEAARRSAH